MKQVHEIYKNKDKPFKCGCCHAVFDYPKYPVHVAIKDHALERQCRESVRVCIGCNNIMKEYKFLSVREYFDTIST